MKNNDFIFSLDSNEMMTWSNAKTIDTYKRLIDERNRTPLSKYDCFSAFNNEQYEQGLKSIRPLEEGEKLIYFTAGVYGTKDGMRRLNDYYQSVRDSIKEQCDPQEVYCYEFNNYESCYDYDGDMNAIRTVVSIFGTETARTVKRYFASTPI